MIRQRNRGQQAGTGSGNRAVSGGRLYDLRQFHGKRVLAGYLFGGIRAYPKQFPYTDEAPEYTSGNVPTKPSDVILKVYITAP